MSTEVQTFEQRVRDKLKKDIADLIPEEQLSKIVQIEMSEFLKTDLPKMIKAMLAEEIKEAINREMRKPQWVGQYNDLARQNVSEQVTKIITENAALMMTSMMAGVSSQLVTDLRYRLQNLNINTFY